MTERACIDGNEAAARVAYALSDVLAIYPITPASPMGEAADAWSAQARPNLWGDVPRVVEMQSEAGAAGVLHGAVTTGALGTTFTASQGLLLMLPEMYKIAGELTPAVIHVAARTVATHALSIFGDHSDVMSARMTGWAMLCAASVQEAHDLALVAHAASLRSRVPFVHFFDGFRTSHEVGSVSLLSDADLRTLVSGDDVAAHRARGLTPDAPVLRGTAQNPDVFFQAREASTPYHAAVPGIVRATLRSLAERTGRAYGLVDYTGATDATRVLVVMGSANGAAAEAVEALVARGERVGLVTVRLFRPFPVDDLLAALPPTVERVAVLDRTKEPGAVGDPLFQDVVTALAEAGLAGVDVVAARYGLSSKEFTPAMAKAVLDELALPAPRRRLTVGIVDDVSGTSVAWDESFRVPFEGTSAVFYGLGSDGTVGSNKMAVKIAGEHSYAQGYFVYDSKKSGSVTVSHLRFSPRPIRSTYLVDRADFVACSQFSLLSRLDVLGVAADGATVLLNSPWGDRTWERLPRDVREQVAARGLRLWAVDARAVARAAGLPGRVNTVMQPCFFALSGILPRDEALEALRRSVAKEYARRGPDVVAANLRAIDSALDALFEVRVPAHAGEGSPRPRAVPEHAPEFVRDVTAAILEGRGDLLPVSALPADGTFPTGTARWEKRGLADEVPVWDPSACVDCGKCTLVCPHAAIRMKAHDGSAHVPAKPFRGTDLSLTIAVSADDCTACALCVDVCPKKGALVMAPLGDRDEARREWEAFLEVEGETPLAPDTVKGSQLHEPLFEFSGACAGCGETPYLKLLTQLFGERMLVANATGCSSIFGGNLPTTPWTTRRDGRGPAWSNSLFEDNAEFGLGMRVASEALGHGDRSVWIVGGDGWAYDIGYGGLDHVLASGADVNVLVLDTEVYSNTGGQASKATPRGAVAKFASAGKPGAKKDLALMAMTYGNVYVARVALGANDVQTVRTLLEAEAWPGPSLVIAYATCIAHGVEVATSMTHQKDAVRSGYWPLFRYRPGEEQPLRLDSGDPTMPVAEFALTETRYASLARSAPERSAELLEAAQADVDARWRLYRHLAGQGTG